MASVVSYAGGALGATMAAAGTPMAAAGGMAAMMWLSAVGSRRRNLLVLLNSRKTLKVKAELEDL
jgi:hypothetical protein